MKTFRVELVETRGGTMIVESESLEEAEACAFFHWDSDDGKVVDRFAWAQEETK